MYIVSTQDGIYGVYSTAVKAARAKKIASWHRGMSGSMNCGAWITTVTDNANAVGDSPMGQLNTARVDVPFTDEELRATRKR